MSSWTNDAGEPIMDGAAYRYEQALDAERDYYYDEDYDGDYEARTAGPAATDCEVVEGDEGDAPQFVARYATGEVFVWTPAEVARTLTDQAHGMDVEPFTLWTWVSALDAPAGGAWVGVEVRQQQGDFDDDDYADVTVQLVRTAGGSVLATTGYRIDGRV